jgi:hypothetical protein
MWRVVGASVRGTSHCKSGAPCQDSSDYRRTFIGNVPALLIGIADGAGSAIASDVGSAQAIEFLFRKASSLGGLRDLNEAVAKEWMQETRAHLASTAENIGVTTRDLACTVLLAVVSEHTSAFIQVGDGAWILEDASNHLRCATWPSGGEYANQTTFITSPGWEDAFQYRRFDDHVLAIAGFSDGLQGLALQFASRTAHAPFFEPMFKALRAAEDETALKAPLIEFLASEAVIERTDDDKSLVLACWDTVKLLCDVA